MVLAQTAPANAQQPPESILPEAAPNGLFREGATVEPFRGFPDLGSSLGWGFAVASAFSSAPVLVVPHVGITANWGETFREESQDGVGSLPPGAFAGFAMAMLHVGVALQAGSGYVAVRTIIEGMRPTPALRHEVSYQGSF